MRYLLYGDPDNHKLRAVLEKALDKDSSLEVLPMASFARSYKKKAAGAFVWLDATGLGEDRILGLGARLGEIAYCAWGVADRGGEIGDPGALFFSGASDYLGPKVLKSAVAPERLRSALVFAGLAAPSKASEGAPKAFPGWASLAVDEDVRVRFCYAALAGQKGLLESIGEKRLNRLREDFASFLEPWSAEYGGIVWIRETQGSLLLFPPEDQGTNPVLAAFRLLLDRALVGYEVFHLETPLAFHFAFHSGTTMWRPPGSTGTVVSDDVNFIFHLGMKTGSEGTILVSQEGAASIPPSLADLFVPQASFEGHRILGSRRFLD